MQRTESRWMELGAMAVHVYTASGAVIAFLIVLAAIRQDVVQALWLGLAALVIDGTDGTLARRFRVSEILPWFDGGRLDDIVDYLTYVFAPVLLLWSAGYLPEGTFGTIIATLPLLASSYQFCRVDAKTADHFFLGFPSYWNVVAFYAVVFEWTPLIVASILLLCAILVFIPIRYVYPSRTVAYRPLTLVLSTLCLLAYTLATAQMPAPHGMVKAVLILYPIYYLGLSFFLTYQIYKGTPK